MSLFCDCMNLQNNYCKFVSKPTNSRHYDGKITTIVVMFWLNTSYLTGSYIVFTLKMESQPKNIIFSLEMMMKSGLEKIILKFLHAGNYFSLLHKIPKITNKNYIFWLRFHFEGKNDVWISQVRRVKYTNSITFHP